MKFKQWIAVKDRHPAIGQMCAFVSSDLPGCHFGRYKADGFWGDDYGLIENVTLWFLVPEPPGGVSPR